MTALPSLSQQTAAGYTSHIETELALALREGTSQLVEPRKITPDARKVIGGMVELLTGFALGTVAGGVFIGTRRWFSEEISTAVQRRFRPLAPVAGRLEVPYLADADKRPLLNEFAGRLHMRFCYLTRSVSELMTALHDTVIELAPRQQGRIDIMLNLLAKEDDVVTRVRAEIRFAWEMFVAKAAGKPLPSQEGRTARSRALWEQWQGRAAPVVALPDEDRSDAQRDGYILLVA